MRDLYTSPSLMRELAPLAFEKAEIPYDPASLDVSDGSYPEAIAASAGGLLDLTARSLNSQDYLPRDGSLHRGGGPECYYWRGMIRADRGVFTVAYNPYRSAWPDEYSLVVNATTSPRGYNEAQRALGRTPGVDSFELVRLPVAAPGYFAAGRYTETFASKQVPCADLTIDTLFMAEHDVDPKDHAAGWICSPPTFCSEVANRADDLVRKYGDSLHDEQNPPREVVRFTGAIDALSGAANGLLELVSGLIQPAGHRDGGEGSNVPDFAALNRALEPQTSMYTFVPEMNHLLSRMGLITPDMTEGEAQQRSVMTVADRVGHAAGLLLTLEEVAPLEDDTTAAKDRRIGILHAVQRAMAELK